MNLHGVVAPYIGAINPFIAVALRVSIGNDIQPNGERTPLYATPAAFTGTISSTTLTVTAIASGQPAVGVTIAGTDIPSDTSITRQLTGDPGGVGTYSLNRDAGDLDDPIAITTTMLVRAQVQPMSYGELRQFEALNLGGNKIGIYLYGQFDGVVRPKVKGGDLVTIPSGPNAGTWLVVLNFEQWPDWCKVAATLQNGS